MSRPVLAVVLAIVLGCSLELSAQSNQVSASDRAAVAGLWNEIIAAAQKKDRAALERIYAEDFLHIHAKGIADDRKTRIDALLAGGPTIDTGGEVDLRLRRFGETIIAAGKIKTVTDDGKPVTYAVTKIYGRSKERLLYLGSHASVVASP